jgi:hypothetical protein
MRFPPTLLAVSLALFAIPSLASAQTSPPMPTSLDAAPRLTLPRTVRTNRVASVGSFAAIQNGKCKTPVSVTDKVSTVSVPMFVLISGAGKVAKVAPLNTDCPGLDTIVAREQLRMMKGNTPIPADGQPHWYWTTMDFSIEFQE